MRSALESFGYELIVCMGGQACIQHMQNEERKPDLILLDLMMPGMNGFDVLQVQRNSYPLESLALPIIMVSAKNQVSSVVKGFELGCNDWIHKPFDRADLAARVHMQLR